MELKTQSKLELLEKPTATESRRAGEGVWIKCLSVIEAAIAMSLLL